MPDKQTAKLRDMQERFEELAGRDISQRMRCLFEMASEEAEEAARAASVGNTAVKKTHVRRLEALSHCTQELVDDV